MNKNKLEGFWTGFGVKWVRSETPWCYDGVTETYRWWEFPDGVRMIDLPSPISYKPREFLYYVFKYALPKIPRKERIKLLEKWIRDWCSNKGSNPAVVLYEAILED